jgi:hypothetical protein
MLPDWTLPQSGFFFLIQRKKTADFPLGRLAKGAGAKPATGRRSIDLRQVGRSLPPYYRSAPIQAEGKTRRSS